MIKNKSNFHQSEVTMIYLNETSLFRSQACTVRDQILWEERNDEKRIRLGGRGSEKNRKKLAELEAQLVLASPNLVLRVAHKSQQNRVQNSYTFFLSSEFERSQWVEAVEALQQVSSVFVAIKIFL